MSNTLSNIPNHHLLRTLAAVPPNSCILDANAGTGRHTIPLLQLGFEVAAWLRNPELGECLVENGAPLQSFAVIDALDIPDVFDWVIAYRLLEGEMSEREVLFLLHELKLVMRSGAWLYVAVQAANSEEVSKLNGTPKPLYFTDESLTALMEQAGFVVAEKPHLHQEDVPLWIGIFRNVTEQSIG